MTANKKSLLLIPIVVGIAILLSFAGIYAGTAVQDMIKMENKAYSKHTRSIVLFSHKKHEDDYKDKYPDLYKAGCGECHHDENNKPLASLKTGDDVQNCIECHKKAGYITGKKAKGLSKKQKREYHANAIHDNCKGCHKKFNKKKGFKSKDKGAAPYTCNKCHPKKKK